MDAGTIDMADWEPDYTVDPYPYLGDVRQSGGPRLVSTGGLDVWLITRYEDVRAVLADPRISNDPDNAGPAALAVPWTLAGNKTVILRHMLRLDAPSKGCGTGSGRSRTSWPTTCCRAAGPT
jgi:cytochrome P450